MTVDEFKKLVIGRSIYWGNNRGEYMVPIDVANNGLILYYKDKSTIHKGNWNMSTGLRTSTNKNGGWKYVIYSVDELLDIANKGREAFNELTEKHIGEFEIKNSVYVTKGDIT